MKWKRLGLCLDWLCYLIFAIISLPLIICLARAIARAMSEHE